MLAIILNLALLVLVIKVETKLLTSLDELMVIQGKDKVFDGWKVMEAGKLLKSMERESSCKGVLEELQVWEVTTKENGKWIKNHFEMTKVVDVTQDTMQIFNVEEPWIKGHLIIR